MKPVINEKIYHHQKQTADKVQDCWSCLNASWATRNSVYVYCIYTMKQSFYIFLYFLIVLFSACYILFL